MKENNKNTVGWSFGAYHEAVINGIKIPYDRYSDKIKINDAREQFPFDKFIYIGQGATWYQGGVKHNNHKMYHFFQDRSKYPTAEEPKMTREEWMEHFSKELTSNMGTTMVFSDVGKGHSYDMQKFMTQNNAFNFICDWWPKLADKVYETARQSSTLTSNPIMDMDREALKKYIRDKRLDIEVHSFMDEIDLRALIRAVEWKKTKAIQDAVREVYEKNAPKEKKGLPAITDGKWHYESLGPEKTFEDWLNDLKRLPLLLQRIETGYPIVEYDLAKGIENDFVFKQLGPMTLFREGMNDMIDAYKKVTKHKITIGVDDLEMRKQVRNLLTSAYALAKKVIEAETQKRLQQELSKRGLNWFQGLELELQKRLVRHETPFCVMYKLDDKDILIVSWPISGVPDLDKIKFTTFPISDIDMDEAHNMS